MKLFRFIFLVLIIALIVFAIFKRDELVAFLERVTHGENFRVAETTVKKSTTKNENKTKTNEKPNPVAAKPQDKLGVTSETESSKKPETKDLVEPKTGKIKDNDLAESAASKNQQDESADKGKADAESEEKTQAESLLHDKAKQAAKAGEYETALQAYQELVEKNPEHIDYWGELGDMLHGMGERPRAAKAYANAVILFKRQGNEDKVRKIMPYIERYAPDLASKIQNRR